MRRQRETRMAGRRLPRPFALPWGRGEITEEASIHGDHWEPTIQLLTYENGTRGLRFCWYSGRSFRRSPMIVREEDLPRLRAALERAPTIRRLLKALVA